MTRAVRLGLALLVAAPTLAAAAAEPKCVGACQRLAANGELREGVNRQGCEVRVCQESARNLYTLARYADALETLDYLAPRLRHSPAYNLDLGQVLYALGRHGDAVQALDRALLAFPDSVRAGAQRGHALLRLRRFDESANDFHRLLGTPAAEHEYRGLRTRSYLLGNLGVVKLVRGDLTGGKVSLTEAFDVDGRNHLAFTYLSDVIPKIESGTIDDEALFRLVVAYEEIGLRNFERAALELTRLIEAAPRFRLGYTLQADVLRRERRFAECETTLREGVRQIPDDPELRAQRIRCTLLRAGPTSEEAAPALAELLELRERYPDNRLVEQILLALDRS